MPMELTGDSSIIPQRQPGAGNPASESGNPAVGAPIETPSYTPEPSSAAPTEPTRHTTVLDEFKRRGYNVDSYQDDDSFLAVLNDVATKQSRIKELEQLAGYGQRYVSEAEEFEKWKASQAQQKPAAQPAEPAKPKWSAPEFDPSWMERVKLDESTGRYVPADAFTTPVLAEKVNAYLAWQQQSGRRLVADPFGVWKEAGGEDFLREQMDSMKKAVREEIFAELRQTKTQEEAEQWAQSNAAHFFAVGPNGQVLRDPQSGEPVLSPLGAQFRQYADEAKSYGITDQAAIRRYATSQIQRHSGEGNPAAANAPVRSPEEADEAAKRQAVASAARATTTPAKGGAAKQRGGGGAIEEADDTFAANPNLSFLQMALAEAKKQGVPLVN